MIIAIRKTLNILVFVACILGAASCKKEESFVSIKLEGRIRDNGLKLVTLQLREFQKDSVLAIDTLSNNEFNRIFLLPEKRFYHVELKVQHDSSDVDLSTSTIIFTQKGCTYQFSSEEVAFGVPFMIRSNSAMQIGYNSYRKSLTNLTKEFKARQKSLSQLQKDAVEKDENKKVDSLTVQKAFEEFEYRDRFYNNLNRFLSSQKPSLLTPLLLLQSTDQEGLWKYKELYLSLLEKLSEADKESDYAERITDRLNLKEKFSVGEKIKTIYGVNTENEKFDFANIKQSKLIYIDFWASWCGPCRAINPTLKEYYKKYHPAGFEIIGISLDDNRDWWVNAIKEDRLPWPNYSDLSKKDRNSQLFNIYDIPKNILISNTGKVLAKDLSLGELNLLLKEYFH